MEWNLDDMLVALGKEVEVLEGHVPIMQSFAGTTSSTVAK